MYGIEYNNKPEAKTLISLFDFSLKNEKPIIGAHKTKKLKSHLLCCIVHFIISVSKINPAIVENK
jgi:hypothetical protein